MPASPGPVLVTGCSTGTGTPGSPYGDLTGKVERSMRGFYANPLLARGPEPVTRAVEHALTARRPRSRYLVTPAAHLLAAVRRVGGDRGWDDFVRQQFDLS